MDVSRIQTTPGSPTLFSVCFQYPDGCGGNITTNNSAASLLSEKNVDDIKDLLSARGSEAIALAVPEVPLEIRRYFLEAASRSGAFVAASFAAAEVGAARESGMFELLDLVSLNEDEGQELVQSKFSPDSPEDFVRKCQDLLRGAYPKLKVIITAGKVGAFGITAQQHQFCPAQEVKVASTAGAGDSLLGGVIAALAAGVPFLSPTSSKDQRQSRMIDSALELGVLLGSYKCLSPHTIHPHASLDTLIEFAGERGFSFAPAIVTPVGHDAGVQLAHSGDQNG
jgi:ribokinase